MSKKCFNCLNDCGDDLNRCPQCGWDFPLMPGEVRKEVFWEPSAPPVAEDTADSPSPPAELRLEEPVTTPLVTQPPALDLTPPAPPVLPPQPAPPPPNPAAGSPILAAPLAVYPTGVRPVIGVLLTYSWKKEGQLFPVRVGRNYIGSGEYCEIRLTDDPELVDRHATITYRPGMFFTINEADSRDNTFISGQLVEEKVRLPEPPVEIRTAGTTWVFYVLEHELKRYLQSLASVPKESQ